LAAAGQPPEPRKLADAAWPWGGPSPECRARTASAKEQFSSGNVRAFAALAQKSSCDSGYDVHNWTCPQCQDVGFQVAPETARLVRRAQLGERGATSIYVAKLRWLPSQEERVYAPRLRTSLARAGEACLSHCGGWSGWCEWCGIGHSCCHPTNASANAAECGGATFVTKSGAFHQCAETSTDREPEPEPLQNEGQDCYQLCGQAPGYCAACGSGNACCHRGLANSTYGPLECRGVQNFTSAHHECVKPVFEKPPHDPDDFGCVISFRGTRLTSNLIKDFDFVPASLPYEECKGCKVHKGFLEVWLDVERKVVRVLDDLGCRPGTNQSSLLITGHSMGGALSTLAMFTMQARGYSVTQAYNFASPRVGNSAFRDTFWEWFGGVRPPLFRVTHSNDVISQTPPHLMFKHVGSELYFPGEDPKRYVICGCEESSQCQGGLPFWKLLFRHWSSQMHCIIPVGGAVGNICRCNGDILV